MVYFTVMLIIADPVYLTEPFIRTRNYELSLSQSLGGYSCVPAAEIAGRPEGYVPHYLPGKNPFLANGTERFALPKVALEGGAESMYPEFKAKLADPSAPVTMPFPATKAPMVAKRVQPPLDKVEITVLPVQGNVYLLAGAGGNTTVQVGETSVTVVDTQYAALSGKLLEAIRKISKKPIRYIINTSFDPDHTGANAEIAKAGDSVGGSNISRDLGAESVSSAAIVAHENTLNHMSAPTGAKSAIPFAAWPTDTFVTPKYELFDGEAIQVIHEPAAHTDGDSIVFFRRSDVISTGDIFSTVSFPVIDRAHGGSIAGEIKALNHLIDLTVPRDKQEGGTYVVPGHGHISDEADLVEYRDMVTIIRDRIADLIAQGKSLDQIKAAQPTLDFDGVYGAPTDTWTKEMFIEAVYADLSEPGK
jgi:glyoxylase-like metal-dependent hydrolase (beta-lactamase superfamily II)